MYTFFNVAWLLGPLIAGYLSEAFGISLIFMLSAVFILVGALFFELSKIRDSNIKKKTHTNIIKNFRDFTLLEVSPHTGRTHQIRVHLKSIGNPVAGDPLYGRKKDEAPEGLDRLFLHAYKLQFTSPDGKALTFETDLPDELQKVLNMLK